MEEISLFGLKVGPFLTAQTVEVALKVAILIAVGLPLLILLSRSVRIYVAPRYSPQRAMVAGKLIYYTGFVILTISVMHELGFSLAPLLGAAGVVGIALGFASQTSVSNIISGLFLIAEQPFVVGDLISIGNNKGFVMSIDMLSVKLRSLDNQFIRIPNESIVKSEVTNITRFPIRRLDVSVGVAYREDIGQVKAVLLEIADRNPLALQKPEARILFSGFGASSIDLILTLWVTREDFVKLKNSIYQEIKGRFDREGIEIPFPHVSLYSGSETQPFPVAYPADLEKAAIGRERA